MDSAASCGSAAGLVCSMVRITPSCTSAEVSWVAQVDPAFIEAETRIEMGKEDIQSKPEKFRWGPRGCWPHDCRLGAATCQCWSCSMQASRACTMQLSSQHGSRQ